MAIEDCCPTAAQRPDVALREMRIVPIARLVATAFALMPNVGCGIVAPSCRDESGSVLNASGQVTAGGVSAHEVVSPRHSNLVMRLTWTDPNATLGLRATIISCGEHDGCSMGTSTPAFGPSGSSPIPQPWPAGFREMLVDGTRGKTYRVDVTGDADRDTSFTLAVLYTIM